MQLGLSGFGANNSRPRVGLDLHCFDGPPQGIRSHVLGLFPEVIARCPQIDFFVFAQKLEQLRSLDPSWGLPNVQLVPMAPKGSACRLLWQLPRLARKHRLDLLHVQYVAPPGCGVPCIVTLHDVLFESHPELFPWHFRLRSHHLMRRSAHAAAHVMTVSAFSKQEIQRLYRLAPTGVTVIPNAVDGTRFYPGDAEQELIQKRGLVSRRYILNVGRIEPRKNLVALARAHAKVMEAFGPDAPELILAGKPGLGAKQVLKGLEPFQASGRVRVLQQVGDAELPALLRHAQLFCYPSIAEGFGMPPLEAMASGIPVITSKSTALTEVVGSAGLLTEPGDEEALTRALLRLVRRPAEREKFAAAGLQRALRFSWKKSADTLAATYCRCLGLQNPQKERKSGDLTLDAGQSQKAGPSLKASSVQPQETRTPSPPVDATPPPALPRKPAQPATQGPEQRAARHARDKQQIDPHE